MKASEDTAATHFLVLAQSVDFARKIEPRQIAMGRQLWFPRHLLVSHRHQSETQSSGTGGDKCIEANQIVDVVFPAPTISGHLKHETALGRM